MQVPYNILLSPESWRITGEPKVFPERHNYITSSALQRIIETQKGQVSFQQFSGHDYFFDLWTFSLNESADVRMEVLQGFIGLAFCFGEEEFNFFDLLFSLPPKTCSLIYFPKANYSFQISKGHSVLLILMAPEFLLHGLAKEHLCVRNLYNSWQFDSNESGSLGTLKITAAMTRMIKLLLAVKGQGASLDFRIRVIIIELLGLYNEQLRMEGIDEDNVSDQNKKSLTDLIQFIQNNLSDEKINIKQMARRFHFSLSKMRKLFKVEMGCSIQEYIRVERLKYARKLLTEDKLSVFDVACLVGYSATSNFVRSYKKMFGHTPGEEK